MNFEAKAVKRRGKQKITWWEVVDKDIISLN